MSYSVLEFQKLIDELVTLLGHNNNEDAREFYFNKLEDYFKVTKSVSSAWRNEHFPEKRLHEFVYREGTSDLMELIKKIY